LNRGLHLVVIRMTPRFMVTLACPVGMMNWLPFLPASKRENRH
jgi:hypothetical protein